MTEIKKKLAFLLPESGVLDRESNKFAVGVKQDNEKGAAMMQGVANKVRVASKEKSDGLMQDNEKVAAMMQGVANKVRVASNTQDDVQKILQIYPTFQIN